MWSRAFECSFTKKYKLPNLLRHSSAKNCFANKRFFRSDFGPMKVGFFPQGNCLLSHRNHLGIDLIQIIFPLYSVFVVLMDCGGCNLAKVLGLGFPNETQPMSRLKLCKGILQNGRELNCMIHAGFLHAINLA